MTEPIDPAPGPTGIRVVGLDHVVLWVRDVERSAAWYSGEFGLPLERMEEWRRGEVLFPSLRLDDTTIIDLLQGEPDGCNVDHIALVVDGVDLDELATSDRFAILMGPADLSGARGVGRGVYVEDPDGHKVELRTYR